MATDQRTSAFDVAVIGAGAAGMMCAAQAGQRGRRVALIEHYRQRSARRSASPAAGAAISRTSRRRPRNISPATPITAAKRSRATPPPTSCALVERHGIRITRKSSASSSAIARPRTSSRMLKAECERGRVTWRVPCAVERVAHDGSGFDVATSQGGIRAASLVVATGGLTVPKIGATPFAYRIAEQFGLAVVAAAAGAGAARLGTRRPRALRRALRRVRRRGGRLRRRPLSREPAVHAPRAVGARDPADLVVLGRQDADRRSTCCRASTRASGSRRGRGATRASPNLLAERLPQARGAGVVCGARSRAADARGRRGAAAHGACD